VYVDDLTYGPQAWLRGSWADRLEAIDRDLAAMEALAGLGDDAPEPVAGDAEQPGERTGPPSPARASHRPPPAFHPGEDLPIALEVSDASVAGAALRYRHVDQSERYVQVEMTPADGGFVASIPGDYANGRYPLQYLFVIRDDGRRAWLHPGLGPTLSDQPYFVVRSRT
jgi:hypothetical protein